MMMILFIVTVMIEIVLQRHFNTSLVQFDTNNLTCAYIRLNLGIAACQIFLQGHDDDEAIVLSDCSIHG